MNELDRNRDLSSDSDGIDLDSGQRNLSIVGNLCTNSAGAKAELSTGSLEGLIRRFDALGYRIRITIEPKRNSGRTVEEAVDWLQSTLSDGGIPSELLFEMAKLEGFSKPMVYEAGGKINAQKRPSVRDGIKCWIWEIRS